MRKDLSHIDQYRDKSPDIDRVKEMHARLNSEFLGSWTMPLKGSPLLFGVIASIGGGEWEHVSVVPIGASRLPRWPEMCQIKDLYWDGDEYVLQFHPRKSDYVDIHPFCLHLWRNRLYPQRVPDSWDGKPFDREAANE